VTRSRGTSVLALVAVLLVAACLRPAITSVGPVLDEVGRDAGLGHARLGLLGALPLLLFAVVSPLAGPAVRWRGAEQVIVGALLGLMVGIVVRSWVGGWGLWLGTALAGGSIALANVVTPTLLKRDFTRAALATAVFTTTLSGAAALASGFSVPLADDLGGWRAGLSAWALVPALVLPLWLVRSRTAPSSVQASSVDRQALRVVLRSAIAWQVAFFFGLQSLVFYTLVTWLPTIEQAAGTSAAAAGLHLLVLQLVGLPIGLLVGLAMERRTDQRLTAVCVSLPVVVAMTGLAVAPGLALLWVVVGCTGTGSSLAVALAVVLQRTPTSAHTTALSGMAQSFGYLLAAAGPILAGEVAERAGWRVVLLGLAGIALAQTVLAFWAARPTLIDVPAEAGRGEGRVVERSGLLS
jgi:CP family cyanate transporter-like MFS transporter